MTGSKGQPGSSAQIPHTPRLAYPRLGADALTRAAHTQR